MEARLHSDASKAGDRTRRDVNPFDRLNPAKCSHHKLRCDRTHSGQV